jgi:hypothetical protein
MKFITLLYNYIVLQNYIIRESMKRTYMFTEMRSISLGMYKIKICAGLLSLQSI